MLLDSLKNFFHLRIPAVSYAAGVCDEWCRRWRFYDRLLPTVFLAGILFFLVYFLTLAAPLNFPTSSLIKITKDESLSTVAQELKDRHLIRSVYLFEFVAKVYEAGHPIVAGEYFFPGPQTVLTIGRRIAHGDYELIPVKVTIPEGLNVYSMADLLDKKIPDFDKQEFLNEAQSKEGYLFPDTYFFLPGEEPKDVIAMLEANFKRRISDPQIAQAILQFGKPLSDVVIMASLLEKEASNLHDRQLIAGVLWRRLAIGMPLQVDAVFPYIIGKNSLQLTHADLKTQSPYNTYTNAGLPPGPIADPGIDSILAAVTPVKTTYLFYLSDLSGNFHFCATYTCQAANQRKYLK